MMQLVLKGYIKTIITLCARGRPKKRLYKAYEI